MKAGLKFKVLVEGIGWKNIALLVLIISSFFFILTYSLGVVQGSQEELNEFARDRNVNKIKLAGEMNPEVFESERIGISDRFFIPYSREAMPLNEVRELEKSLNGDLVPRKLMLWNIVEKREYLNIYLIGISPQDERRVSDFELSEGRQIENRGEALVDSNNARKLGLEINDTINVSGGLVKTEHRVESRNISLKVVGILEESDLLMPVNSPVKSSKLNQSSPFVESGIFLNIDDLSNLSAREGATEVLVINSNVQATEEDLERINNSLKLKVEEEVSSYKYLTKDYRIFINSFSVILIGLLVVVSVASAGIVNIALKSRVEDFETLKALGFRDKTLFKYFIVVPSFIVSLSVLIGVFSGYVFSMRPVIVPSLFANLGEILPVFSLREVGIIALIGVFIVILTILPALKLGKKFFEGGIK